MAFYSDRFCFEFSREKQYVKDLAKCVIFGGIEKELFDLRNLTCFHVSSLNP